MALGSPQPLTPGVQGGRRVGMTTLPPSCAEYREIWDPHLLGPSGPAQASNGISLPFTFSLLFTPVSDDLIFI